MKLLGCFVVAISIATATLPAIAQFTGPSARGHAATVADVQSLRMGSYVVLTGNIVDHQRSDYFTFRDSTGEIRVEIEPQVWRDRPVTPETDVQIMGEVDRGVAGRYVWVKTLDIVQ